MISIARRDRSRPSRRPPGFPVDPIPPDGTQVWRGSIEITLVARQFPADSAIGQFARDDFQRSYEAFEKKLPDDMPARFVLAADGSVRGEQTTDLGGGRVLTIRAERISRDVIPDPRRYKSTKPSLSWGRL